MEGSRCREQEELRKRMNERKGDKCVEEKNGDGGQQGEGIGKIPEY